MLPAKKRLSKKEDFQRAFRQGKTFTLQKGLIFLKVAKNDTGESSAGFLVGKNFSKKAVVRNKARRILQETVRNKWDKIKPGFDIIVVCGKNTKKGKIKSADLFQEVSALLGKANLIKK